MILNGLLSILTKRASEDEVSAELADILGYEELDLVSEILANRQVVRREVSLILPF